MTPFSDPHADRRSSRQIEQEIRDRRDKMDSTLDELGSRLTLRSLVHNALDWWDSPPSGSQGSLAARRATRGLARQIKHHPFPSLLIGSGIAWLIAESTGDDDDDLRPSSAYPRGTPSESDGGGIKGSLHHAKDSAGETIGNVRSKASGMSDRLQQSTGEMMHRTMDRGQSAARRLGHDVVHGYRAGADQVAKAVDDYPLAVGAACAALGSLVGLILPHTRREDDWLGERSDDLIESAKTKGEDLLESGKSVGKRVAETVKEEVREQGLTPDNVSGAMDDLVAKGGQVMDKAKAEASQAAKEEGLAPDRG